MFWGQGSLLYHHALVMSPSLGVSVHGQAHAVALPWGVGQLLGPLQRFHQMGVGPLGGIVSAGISLARVGCAGHHMGRGSPALLHAWVHRSGVVHEAS